jgi:hypothetical protein
LFVLYNSDSKFSNYWSGTVISFSGKNGAYFYKVIEAKKIDWNIFSLGSLNFNIGRLDLHYFRKYEFTDQQYSLELFMENSCQKIHAKSKSR